MALKIPTRTENQFIEHRGTYADVQVEDRPFRIIENEFDEKKGCMVDRVEHLTDIEILEAGGIDHFFKKDGSRRVENWPGQERRPDPVPTTSDTKTDLLKYCRDNDVEADKKMTKAEIMEAINNHQ